MKQEGNVLKLKAIVIFTKGEVFIIHGYDSVGILTQLIDWADDEYCPVNWDQAIDAVYKMKQKQVSIIEEDCHV